MPTSQQEKVPKSWISTPTPTKKETQIAKTTWKRCLYQTRCLLFAPPHSSDTHPCEESHRSSEKGGGWGQSIYPLFPSLKAITLTSYILQRSVLLFKDQCSSEGGLLNGTLSPSFWPKGNNRFMAASLELLYYLQYSLYTYIKLLYTTHTHPKSSMLSMLSFSCWSSVLYIAQSHYCKVNCKLKPWQNTTSYSPE